MSFPSDWTVLSQQARNFLPGHALKHKPEGIPSEANFATPHLLGYWEAKDGSGAEVTTGMMPDFGARPLTESRLVGITFGDWTDQRNQACFSWAEVRDALGYTEQEE